jgi:hypothetical protein
MPPCTSPTAPYKQRTQRSTQQHSQQAAGAGWLARCVALRCERDGRGAATERAPDAMPTEDARDSQAVAERALAQHLAAAQPRASGLRQAHAVQRHRQRKTQRHGRPPGRQLRATRQRCCATRALRHRAHRVLRQVHVQDDPGAAPESGGKRRYHGEGNHGVRKAGQLRRLLLATAAAAAAAIAAAGDRPRGAGGHARGAPAALRRHRIIGGGWRAAAPRVALLPRARRRRRQQQRQRRRLRARAPPPHAACCADGERRVRKSERLHRSACARTPRATPQPLRDPQCSACADADATRQQRRSCEGGARLRKHFSHASFPGVLPAAAVRR